MAETTNPQPEPDLTELELREQLYDAMDGNLRMSLRRKLLDGYREVILASVQTAPAAVPSAPADRAADAEPACKFDEGCHRVVACEPGCGTVDLLVEATRSVPPPVDRAAILREAADAVFAMDYDEFRANSQFDGLRSAWELGTIDAARLLRRMADEAQQPEAKDGRCPALFDQFSAHHEMRRLDPDSPERCAYCGKTDAAAAAVSQPGKEA